jgi:hypothetical protein
MNQLERSLAALATEIEWPETPPLELRLEPSLHRRRDLRRPLALAFALLLAALGIAFAVPPARSAILRFLHLGGVTIERTQQLPSAEERALRASLGTPVAAERVRAELGFRPLLPPQPQRLRLYARDGTVSVLLEQPTVTLLTEFRSDIEPGVLVKKLAGDATRIEVVRVGGAEGFWLSGARHVVVEPGLPPRYAGNTLLWQRGNVTLRLEGRLTEADALRIARTIR